MYTVTTNLDILYNTKPKVENIIKIIGNKTKHMPTLILFTQIFLNLCQPHQQKQNDFLVKN